MTIDFGFDFIDPDSEYAQNLKHNLSMGDEDGIMIGNCYYTNEMLKEQEEKNKIKDKNFSNFFDPNDIL